MIEPEQFLTAQDSVYEIALGEITSGRKQSHWMWFIFPILAGLGKSEIAQRFALADAGAARAYHNHAILGARLLECTNAALIHKAEEAPNALSARELFGAPDDWKFHGCMTLFHRAVPDEPVFRSALDAFFDGAEEEKTIARL